MKKTKILYWTFTSLFAFFMLGSAIPDIVSSQGAIDGFNKMSMPAYLTPFLGIAKVLGVIAILIPGYPRIKEWAYAGFTFHFIGACASRAYAGDSIGLIVSPLIFMALMFISYFLWKKMEALKAV